MNTTTETEARSSPPAQRPGRRRAAAAIAAVVLVGSAAAYAVTRSGAVTVALRWHDGQTLRYRSTLGLRGEATPAGGVPSSFAFRVIETLTWRVRSVDARGTATIDLTASDVRVEGGPASGARPGQVTGRLTVDRRV